MRACKRATPGSARIRAGVRGSKADRSARLPDGSPGRARLGVGLILALRNTDIAALAAAVRPGPGRRLVRTLGAHYLLVGTGLAAAWMVMWGGHVFLDRPTLVPPDAFRLVAALDLTLMVPALVAAGALLWRSEPWGYLLGAMAGTQGTLYLLVLSVGSLTAAQRGITPSPGEAPIWGSLAILTGVATSRLIAQLRG